ncbi:Heme ABC transporter ATP-binding protein OS=Lysinibacillus sphaericus OX=1421 GN=LS41612_02870 PE=4 SV=1 [Lysinibacillus sphaericus]
MTLEAKEVSFSIHDQCILEKVSIQIKAKQFVGLIGLMVAESLHY